MHELLVADEGNASSDGDGRLLMRPIDAVGRELELVLVMSVDPLFLVSTE